MLPHAIVWHSSCEGSWSPLLAVLVVAIKLSREKTPSLLVLLTIAAMPMILFGWPGELSALGYGELGIISLAALSGETNSSSEGRYFAVGVQDGTKVARAPGRRKTSAVPEPRRTGIGLVELRGIEPLTCAII